MLLVLAGLIALVALFYAEKDWRGKRAWENCKRELEAKGHVLDWAELIPLPVRDGQNFFDAPEMQEWFMYPKLRLKAFKCFSFFFYKVIVAINYE